MSLPEEEVARLIHLRNEMLLMVEEWKKHGWGTGLAARFRALSMVLSNEPAPSRAFKNLSTKKRALTEEECRTLVNGSLLALAQQAGGTLHVRTSDIFQAHADLGTLAIAIADDDSHITITGMKQQ